MKRPFALLTALTLTLTLAACGGGGAPAPTPDTTAPVLSNVTVTPGAQSVRVRVRITEAGRLTHATYRMDGGEPYGVTLQGDGPDYEFELPRALVGQHTLVLVAYDEAGNASLGATQTFTVGDTTAPVNVQLTASAPSFSADGTLTLSATASDDVGVARVDFYEGLTKVGTDSTPADGFSVSVPYTRANNGTHTYTARAVDAAGNASPDSAPVNVTVNVPDPVVPDTTAPTVGATLSQAAGGYRVTANVTAADNIGVTARSYRLDGGAAVAFSGSSIDFGDLSIGNHSVVFSAKDAAGNEGTATASITVKDVTKPTVGATLTQAAGSYSVTLAVTDGDNVGVTERTYSLDGGAAMVFTGASVDLGALSIGSHSVEVSVKDAAGNAVSTTASLTVADVTRPTVTATLSQAQGGYAVTASVTAADNVAVTSGTYRLDGAVPVPFSGASVDLGSLSIGDHSVVFTVADAAGNEGSVTASITVQDVTAPDAPTLSVSPAAPVGGGPITLTATGGPDIVKVIFLLNGTEIGSDSDPADGFSWTGTVPTNLTNATYSAVACDADGNCSAIGGGSSVTVAVTDVAAPTAPTLSATPASPAGGDALTLSASGASDNIGVAAVQFYQDGVLIGTDSDPSDGFSWATTAPDAAGVTYTAAACDAAGNCSPAGGASITVTVRDVTSPTVSATLTQASGGYGVSASVTAADNIGVTTRTYSLDGAAPVNFSGSSVDLGSLSIGTHSVVFTVQDAAGNAASTTVTLDVTDVTNPTVGATLTQAASSYSVTLNVTAADNVAVTSGSYTVDGGAPVPFSGSSVNLGDLSIGAHSVEVTVRDAAGNAASVTEAITVRDVTAPSVSATLTQAAGGYGVTLAVTAADNVAVASRSYRLDGGAAVTLSGGSVDLGELSIGAHSVEVTVRDAAGNEASTTASVTVKDVTAPTVSATLSQGAPSGAGYAVSASVTAADNVAVTSGSYRVDGGAPVNFSGSSVNLGTLSVGAHSVVFTVQDAEGNAASTTATLTVQDVTAPTVSALSASPASVTGGQSYTLSATASDNVGVTRVDFYQGGALVGSDTTPGDGFTYTGTAANATATLNFTAVARDAAGNASAASAATTVTVTADATKPTITSPTFNQNGSGSYTVTATLTDNGRVAKVELSYPAKTGGVVTTDITSGLTGTSLSYTDSDMKSTGTVTLIVTDAAGNVQTATLRP